jgi:hypothetical protein
VGKAILLILALSTVLVGCNPGQGGQVSAKTQIFNAGHELVATAHDYYSYQYVDSSYGCTTGQHEFDQHDQLCAALVNEPLNNYCAWQERHDRYYNECQ